VVEARDEQSFWSRRVGRRSMLRAAGMGAAGLTAAALLGCSGDDGEGDDATPAVQPTASPEPTVPPDRNEPRFYSGPIPATSAEKNPQARAKRGGTLRMRYLEPPHLDINRTLSCTTYHPLSYTLSKLTRARTGANADPFAVEIEPDLAESWAVNADATEFTFKLRQGVQTHNRAPVFGREFTSEDVRLSWERYQSGGSQRDVYTPVSEVLTPDEYTVIARLDQPHVDFAASIASWSYLWPRELIEDEDRLEREAIGTGPFVQEEWVRGERAVFRAHPGYFERGLPYVDEVIVSVDDDRASAQAKFVANEFFDADVLDDVEMQDLLARAAGTALGFKFPRSRGANVNGWHFQLDNPLFQDERVRRAISLAFDRGEYDRARNAGDNESPDGPFSNSPMPWPSIFNDYPTAAANGEWYRYDPARASALMQAAGYSVDSPLSFELVSYYFTESFPQHVIPGINASLAEVNIRYRNVDQQTYIGLLSNRDFDSAIGIVWGPPGYSIDQWIFPWWHSRGGLNYNNVNDAELDTLLERQRAEIDPAAQRETWRAIWDRVHDRVYDVWWPEAHTRGAQHNYLLNMRWHGLIGSYLCYGSDQARAVWLDDGAPGLRRRAGPPLRGGRT
jgi:peptide/nickel transport system substrate-binding protein